MTVPTLISKYQKHTYVVGLKKAYSQLSNAVKMIPLSKGCPAGDYDCAGMWHLMGMPMDLIANQFKTEKVCYNDSRDTDCEWLEIFDDNSVIATGYATGFITQDGTAFAWNTWDSWEITVDVNGTKGPNKVGRDQFGFRIAPETRDGIQEGTVMPFGSKQSTIYNPENNSYWKDNDTCTTEKVNSGGSWDAVSCTGRVLDEDAMNY